MQVYYEYLPPEQLYRPYSRPCPKHEHFILYQLILFVENYLFPKYQLYRLIFPNNKIKIPRLKCRNSNSFWNETEDLFNGLEFVSSKVEFQ